MHDDNPYRLYRVLGLKGEPEIVATTATKEGMGTAIATLGEEGEFDGCTLGVLYREDDEEAGAWLVNPWPSMMGQRDWRLVVAVAPASGKQHLCSTRSTGRSRMTGIATLCGRSAANWESRDELIVSKPVCRACKSAGETITRTSHGAVAMPVRSL